GGRITIDRAPREMTSFLWFREVDEAYFSTLDLPILDGRSFTRTDTSGSPLVVVVSESFGRLIAGDESPLGHTVSVRTDEGEPAVAEVVGVVPDLITNVNATEPLVMYYALAQRDRSLNAALAIRTAADARARSEERRVGKERRG